jgi:hypothetical protein
MLLMDTINATAHLVLTSQAHSRNPVLSAFPDLMRRLTGTPRFLFDNAAIGTAVELTLGRPKILREALTNLRVPYPRMWVEWEEAGRKKLRDRFESANDLPLPQRVGYLLECDDAGRRGTITWLWTSSNTDVLRLGKFDCPCVAPIQAEFDLDREFDVPQHLIEGLLRANLGQLWGENPVQRQALLDIWRVAEHKPSAWGEKYLLDIYKLGQMGLGAHAYLGGSHTSVNSPEDFARFVAVQYADVFGELIQAWATLLMLTASRPIIEREHVSMTKLNKIRRKKNEPLLCDHTRVTLHIKARPQGPVIERGPLGYARKSPRIHLVSSYLARRGERHWIVQPYMRGRGETIHRRTRVTP